MTNLSPKDKEKLFNEICEYQHIVSHKDAAMELANQYSEQIAIGLIEFISEFGFRQDNEAWWTKHNQYPDSYTNAELYNLYKQSINESKG